MGEKLFRTWDFPQSGSKAEDGERKKERLNNGDNNGQATYGARKHAWRMQAAWANILVNEPPIIGVLLCACVGVGDVDFQIF